MPVSWPCEFAREPLPRRAQPPDTRASRSNVLVGYFQELSAEKTMNALRSLASPTARVIRDGHSSLIPAGELVPGDVIELNVGDTIPADVRLVEAMNFESDEGEQRKRRIQRAAADLCTQPS